MGGYIARSYCGWAQEGGWVMGKLLFVINSNGVEVYLKSAVDARIAALEAELQRTKDIAGTIGALLKAKEADDA